VNKITHIFTLRITINQPINFFLRKMELQIQDLLQQLGYEVSNVEIQYIDTTTKKIDNNL